MLKYLESLKSRYLEINYTGGSHITDSSKIPCSALLRALKSPNVSRLKYEKTHTSTRVACLLVQDFPQSSPVKIRFNTHGLPHYALKPSRHW
jgi:hypothetical protein